LVPFCAIIRCTVICPASSESTRIELKGPAATNAPLTLSLPRVGQTEASTYVDISDEAHPLLADDKTKTSTPADPTAPADPAATAAAGQAAINKLFGSPTAPDFSASGATLEQLFDEAAKLLNDDIAAADGAGVVGTGSLAPMVMVFPDVPASTSVPRPSLARTAAPWNATAA
jgi:hypothetical protein